MGIPFHSMDQDCPETLGRYQLLALLAKGGMAEIHLAKQQGIEGFERLVVIKRILPSLSGEKRFLEMFLDEARIAAQLSHQNIVQVHDLGEEGGEYYIAMEYLEGESLGYLVREANRVGRTLPPEIAAGIVSQVCDGLHYAHTLRDEAGDPLNIVHRDVCPHNTIVLFSGVVKLVDFGIAKAASQMHKTRVGTLKGKFAYMAPEQVLAQPVDARSDLFSLGVVFWELLARRRLFKRNSEGAMVHAIVNDAAPSIRKIRPEVPPELESIVDRALQKQPGDRFQSAAQMGKMLREHLRQAGAAAGVHDIAAFVETVFAERARTKRRLLEDIRMSGGKRVSLRLLKPDTDESLPSHSGVVEAEEEDDILDIPTHKMKAIPDFSARLAAPESGAAEEVSASSRRRILPVVLSLFAGLVVAGMVLWIVFGTGEEPGEPEKAAVPEPVVRPEPGDKVDSPAPTPQAILDILSSPRGCKATLDGVEVPGLTPVAGLSLDAGAEHEITVACPGHEIETRRVTLQPGQNGSVKFAPKPKPAPARKPSHGFLSLNTRPWSKVYLGKKKLGITPLMRLKLPVGKHKLSLVNKERGLRKTIHVEIKPGKNTKRWTKLGE